MVEEVEGLTGDLVVRGGGSEVTAVKAKHGEYYRLGCLLRLLFLKDNFFD